MPEVMSIEVDEEFDPRPPSSPFGLRGPDGSLNIGMIAGIVVAVVLVIMLIFVVVKPFKSDEKPPAVASWSPKDPTKNLEFLESYPASHPMTSSVQNSLDDWAKYFTTGDLRDLSTSFDLTGNQYAQLVAMQPQIAASPEPGDPAKIELGPIGKVSRKGNIFTIRVVVKWTKPGALEGSEKHWDIDMKTDGSLYVLNTVRETNLQDKQPIDFCGAAQVVQGLDTRDEIEKKFATVPIGEKLDKLTAVYDIRVRAWEFVLDAVDGTDSEAQAQTVVDYLENIHNSVTTAKSFDEYVADSESMTSSSQLEESYEFLATRADAECGVTLIEP